jgi:hypothetical protein
MLSSLLLGRSKEQLSGSAVTKEIHRLPNDLRPAVNGGELQAPDVTNEELKAIV